MFYMKHLLAWFLSAYTAKVIVGAIPYASYGIIFIF